MCFQHTPKYEQEIQAVRKELQHIPKVLQVFKGALLSELLVFRVNSYYG